MAQLAIEGHAKRGSEVIALLEMLGGVNAHNLYGDENYAYYTIDCNKEIKGGIYIFGDEDLITFTLEKFLEKFPYKVGDKVSVYEYESKVRINDMEWDGFEIQYSVFTDETEWYSAVELNKFNEPYKEETTENKGTEVKNREIMNAKDFLSKVFYDVVKDENNLLTKVKKDKLLLLQTHMESYYKILYKKKIIGNIIDNIDDLPKESIENTLKSIIRGLRYDLENRPLIGQTNSLSINITILWENETNREIIKIAEKALTFHQKTLCQ